MNSTKFFAWIIPALFLAALAPATLTAQQEHSRNAEKPHYKLVYLDELGGPHITVDGNISCCGILPSIINNSGVAVGSAVTSIPIPTSPVINNPYVVPNPFTIAAAAWQGPAPINLGTLPGGYYSFANGISNTGLIAGISETGEIDPRLGVLQAHPTLWFFGQLIDLGTFGGGEGYGNQVNDFGQVVGYAQNDIADSYDYFGLGTQSRAFLWQFGVLNDLGTLGGNDAQAIFVNDLGQIAGVSYTSSTPATNTGLVCTQGTNVPPQDPFFWQYGKMLDIGNLGGNCAAPAGINIYGQVAGNSDLSDVNAYPHAFLWTPGSGMKDLGTLGGTFAQADALNDSGEVVGTSCTPGDQACFAVLWKQGVITNLGNLPGDCGSSAFAINSRGQITGDSYNCVTGNSRPFLWENGHMYGFHFVAPAGTELEFSEPASINDEGEIVGYSYLNTGFQAFLLVPCGAESREDVTTDADISTQGDAAAHGPRTPNQTNLLPRDVLARLRFRLADRNRGPLLRDRIAPGSEINSESDSLPVERDELKTLLPKTGESCVFSRYKCPVGHTTGCHECGGSTRCCFVECYDTIHDRYCTE
jgi:probable HAF family extracellular repeat protein